MKLVKHVGKLAHINVRDEKHGDDTVLAIDIKITIDVPNTFLDTLSPGLKASLYKADEEQGDLLGEHLTALRYPTLAPLKYGVNMTGAKLVIDNEVKRPEVNPDLDFEVKIKHMVLEAKEGGTVGVAFSAQTLPNSIQVGVLSAMLRQDIVLSLFPGAISQAVEDGENL